MDADEIDLLRKAASKDWSNVEPAIFGTLLENALTLRQRSELGAHFTPRAFVERLVLPTVIEPLRAEWDGAKAAADRALADNRPEVAAGHLRDLHGHLCNVRVLDPACGTGNFLYVTMELMKRWRARCWTRCPTPTAARASGSRCRARVWIRTSSSASS